MELSTTASKLLAIVANTRGANDAVNFEEISYLGFPLSVSEEFQKRNTNQNINKSLYLIEEIQNMCLKNNKKLVVYISMAFGNPYQEKWHPDIVAQLIHQLSEIEIDIVALSDTIGVSNTQNIELLFTTLIQEYPHIQFLFVHGRKKASEIIEKIFTCGCLYKKIDLQLAYDSNVL